jgi:chromosome segregation ATPase
MTTFEDVIDELRTQLDTKEFDINVLTNAHARHREEIAKLKAENEQLLATVEVCKGAKEVIDELRDDVKECYDNYKEMREEAKQMGDENFRLRTRVGLLVDRCNHLRHDPLAEVVYQENAELSKLRAAMDDARIVITNVALAGDRHDQLRKWVFYAFAKSWLLKYPKTK